MKATWLEQMARVAPRAWRALLVAGLLGANGARIEAGPPTHLPPLTVVPGSPRLPGKFVWADLATDDPRKASAFYGRLFGWIFQDWGGYLIGTNDERPLCGLFHRARPADRPEAKPRWFGYLSVSDVSRAEKAVRQGGGRVVVEAQKLPQRGEQAVCADPEGAVFGVVRSSAGDPADFLAEPGDWVWVQLLSRDGRRAGEFYRSVAGYEVVENVDSPRPEDFVLVSKGYARAAVLTMPKDREVGGARWLLFVRVKDVHRTVAEATALGGRVVLAPRADLMEGKLAVLADPGGAEIGVMEWNPEMKEKGR